MAQYRKKPVVIEASQWSKPGDHPAVIAATRTVPAFDEFDIPWEIYHGIKTLEGFMEVHAGDWIITGVRGEQYPCKPDIFAETYEPA